MSMDEREPEVSTSIKVRARIWRGLRALAERDALEHGGRPAMNRTVERLVEREMERVGGAERVYGPDAR
jgi:hypothetical protein